MGYNINPFFKNRSGFFSHINKQVSLIFFLGIASGLPISILFSTINLWLAHIGVSTTRLGLVSICLWPFLFKFLWAPILDNTRVPFFSARFGPRKTLIIVLQTCLIISISSLGFTEPEKNINYTFICLILIAFLTASQDVIMDAYRIELLTFAGQGVGSGVNILGYRVGAFISSFCIPLLADYSSGAQNSYNWKIAFIFAGAVMLATWIAFIFLPEPKKPANLLSKKGHTSFIDAIKDFTQHEQWIWVFVFILTYRINHHFTVRMEKVFWLELGFSLTEIVVAANFFGFIPNVIGVILGTTFIYNLGLKRALMLGLVLPLLSNLMLIIQYNVGNNNFFWLYMYICCSYLASGLGGAVLTTYLDILSKASPYTATLYAFFTSTYTVGKIFLPLLAGYIVSYFGWISFFYLSILLGVIPVIFLSCLRRKW